MNSIFMLKIKCQHQGIYFPCDRWLEFSFNTFKLTSSICAFTPKCFSCSTFPLLHITIWACRLSSTCKYLSTVYSVWNELLYVLKNNKWKTAFAALEKHLENVFWYSSTFLLLSAQILTLKLNYRENTSVFIVCILKHYSWCFIDRYLNNFLKIT